MAFDTSGGGGDGGKGGGRVGIGVSRAALENFETKLFH